jgi:hypothetical protein
MLVAFGIEAIIKKRLGLYPILYTFLQILSVGVFEKTPISQAFSEHGDMTEMYDRCNQLERFNF